MITIEELPYYDGDVMKLKCSVYDVKPDLSGYQDHEDERYSNWETKK